MFFLIALKIHLAAKTKIEHWLGINLPKSAEDFHYYYEQAPGYYQAHLILRFKIPETDFLSVMRDSSFNTAKGDNAVQKLPTDFNTDPSVKWWTRPEEQNGLFFTKTNGAETLCIWSAGYAYFEKDGAFGSTWNRKTVITN